MRTIRGLKVVQVSGDAQSGVSKVFITFARGLRPQRAKCGAHSHPMHMDSPVRRYRNATPTSATAPWGPPRRRFSVLHVGRAGACEDECDESSFRSRNR